MKNLKSAFCQIRRCFSQAIVAGVRKGLLNYTRLCGIGLRLFEQDTTPAVRIHFNTTKLSNNGSWRVVKKMSEDNVASAMMGRSCKEMGRPRMGHSGLLPMKQIKDLPQIDVGQKKLQLESEVTTELAEDLLCMGSGSTKHTFPQQQRSRVERSFLKFHKKEDKDAVAKRALTLVREIAMIRKAILRESRTASSGDLTQKQGKVQEGLTTIHTKSGSSSSLKGYPVAEIGNQSGSNRRRTTQFVCDFKSKPLSTFAINMENLAFGHVIK